MHSHIAIQEMSAVRLSFHSENFHIFIVGLRKTLSICLSATVKDARHHKIKNIFPNEQHFVGHCATKDKKGEYSKIIARYICTSKRNWAFLLNYRPVIPHRTHDKYIQLQPTHPACDDWNLPFTIITYQVRIYCRIYSQR